MIQLIIIAIYALAMLGIGLGMRKKAADQDSFFVAQRRGTLPFITGSLIATALGGSATIGMAGLGFEQGLTGAWWLIAGSAGLLVLGLFFSKKVRSAALYTLPELAEKQYGRRLGISASILIVIAWIGVVAGQIVAAGRILSITGMGSMTLWMIIFTAVFVAYTILAGQYSLIRTDFFQSAILFIGVFITLTMVVIRVGGINGMQTSLPWEYFSFPLSPNFNFKTLLSILILVGATYVVGPDIYTRLFSSREEKTAQRATFLSAFIFIPLAIAITIIGMGAKILYPQISPEMAFPHVINTSFTPFLGGLVLAALVAALMSSADTCLLSQGVILTQDIVKRFHPAIDEKRTILITRLNILLLGLLALGLAIAIKGVISSLLFAYTVFSCGLVVPIIAGFYKDKLKVTPKGAMAALAGGGLIGLLGEIPGLDIPLKEDFGLIGFAVSAILLFTVSSLSRNTNKLERMI